jgi:hypothetical protein
LKSLAKILAAIVAIFGPTPRNLKNRSTTSALAGLSRHNASCIAGIGGGDVLNSGVEIPAHLLGEAVRGLRSGEEFSYLIEG